MPVEHIITVARANRTFNEILNKVHYAGEVFDIKEGKEIIAKIVPVGAKKHAMKIEDLNEFFKNLPALSADEKKEFAKDVKAIRSAMKPENNPWD